MSIAILLAKMSQKCTEEYHNYQGIISPSWVVIVLKELIFIGLFLSVGQCVRCFIHTSLSPPQILPHRYIFTPFYRWKEWGPRLLSTLSWIICSQMSWFASYSMCSSRHLTLSSWPFFSHHIHSLFDHAWRLPCPLFSIIYLPDWALSSCIWGCSFRHLCNLHEAGSTCLTMNR